VTPVANALYAVSPIDGNAGGPITVSAIDEGTGVATTIAQIDGVSSWSPALFVDQTNTHAYAFAANAGGTSVYTVDLLAGTVTAAPLAPAFASTVEPVGVTQEGSVIAVGLTKSTDTSAPIYLVDPTSGTASAFGQIALAKDASLGSVTYDAPSRVLYVVYEENGALAWSLGRYSFDTKAFEASPDINLPVGVVLAGLLPDGEVGAVYAAGDDNFMAVEIDPVTGVWSEIEDSADNIQWPNDATVHEGKLWYATDDANLLVGLDPDGTPGTVLQLSQSYILAHY
jgi:hypothetical protein